MNTHQVVIVLVVDTRVLDCVADPLQERRFASISATDYKDTKASIFRSKVIGIAAAHGRFGWVKENCVGTFLLWNIDSPWLARASQASINKVTAFVITLQDWRILRIIKYLCIRPTFELSPILSQSCFWIVEHQKTSELFEETLVVLTTFGQLFPTISMLFKKWCKEKRTRDIAQEWTKENPWVKARIHEYLYDPPTPNTNLARISSISDGFIPLHH